MGISKLSVALNLGEQSYNVGELITDNKKIYFKYFDDFIATGIQISPFKLPITNAIQAANEYPFDGLFGVFNDSLPDGWGKLLLDKNLTSKGISLNQITPLDRLTYIDKNGIGALSYQPTFQTNNQSLNEIELDILSTETNLILEGQSSDIIEELYNLGGSSGGARPKILVGYNQKTHQIISGTHELPEDFEHWIIKFPSSFDTPDSTNIEYAYYLMAKAAGITMADCKLFEGKSGKYYFGTKRFDRIQNKKLHLHSAAGLLHDNFRLSTLDYGHLMDAAFRLENHVNAYEKILRLATFNMYSHNRDDHSKNFSFLMNENRKWEFSPAYDLTFSNSSHGFQSTTIAGEGKSPEEKHIKILAKNFSFKPYNIIIDEVKEAVSNWKSFAKQAQVSYESEQLIYKTIETLIKS